MLSRNLLLIVFVCATMFHRTPGFAAEYRTVVSGVYGPTDPGNANTLYGAASTDFKQGHRYVLLS